MVRIEPPTQTLSAQPPGATTPAQRPAGTSAGAAIAGNIIAMLIIKSINDSREKPAQEFAAGLDHALSGRDLQAELVQAIRREVQAREALRGALLEDVRDEIDMEQPGLLVRISEPEIYTVDAQCAFLPGYAALKMSTTLRLWRKGEFRPASTSTLEYTSKPLPESPEPREQWVAEDGKALLHALREGIDETARQFVAKAASRASAGAPAPAPAKQP